MSGDMTFGDILDIGQKLEEQPRRVIDSLSKKDAMVYPHISRRNSY
ncbi:MAG: hypothetical protein AB8G05_16890 [Oligoflexales bacterium]